jgi:heterodisulfide reductase subunit C
MAISDLTSMAKPQEEARREINERLMKLQDDASLYCFQCAKCTSGCEAHKLLELEPHRIVGLLQRGLIDELVNSDIVWTCLSCLKCKERCPNRVSPVDIIFAVKNLAVANGREVPGKYTEILQSVLFVGLMQDETEVAAKDGSLKKRENLGLPPLSKPADMTCLQATLTNLAVEKV